MFEGNRVTAHTRSRYPIFQSPMTWIARGPLVTAVSKAGALGLLENSIRDLSVTKNEFAAIRAATNAPFGVNLPIRYLQMDVKEEDAIIGWLLDQGIHFATTSAGDPTLMASATPRKPEGDDAPGSPASVASSAALHSPRIGPGVTMKVTSPSTEALERRQPSRS